VRNLTGRLVVLLMLALMTITGAFDYIRLVRERDRLVELTRTDQRIFAETLALAVRRNVRRGRTTEELQELLGEMQARPGLVWAAIYDPRGHVVAASVGARAAPEAGDEGVAYALKARAPIAELVSGERGQEVRYIQPFPWPDGRVAAVEVRQSLEAVQREFARALREGIAFRGIVLMCFVLAIVFLTRWSIARPIRALIRAARAVGGGDLRQRIEVRHSNEIGELAQEFNRMAESLEEAQRALVEQSAKRLQLEREVQQAQKLVAVGMLAAQVAHEIGTPLNVIAGRAEALGRRLAPDHPDRRQLETIQSQADRIAGIVRDLLEYARPRRPALRAERLPPLLARVVDLVEGRDRDRGVRVRMDVPADLPSVLGDADQLQQVFINLLTNALDASPSGGTVRVTEGPEPVLPPDGRAAVVRGHAEPPVVSVHVLDEGPGVTDEELARIFQPFFSTKHGHGTGLGLPIVEEIVRAHRGEVEMLSIAGRGTEVIVRLPVASPSTGTPAQESVGLPAEAASAPAVSRAG
jgi:signal transduction histidine kinase